MSKKDFGSAMRRSLGQEDQAIADRFAKADSALLSGAQQKTGTGAVETVEPAPQSTLSGESFEGVYLPAPSGPTHQIRTPKALTVRHIDDLYMERNVTESVRVPQSIADFFVFLAAEESIQRGAGARVSRQQFYEEAIKDYVLKKRREYAKKGAEGEEKE